MADSKLTALTALTTFTGDELFYVVEDDDGTPVSRKVTVEDLVTGLASFFPGQSPIDVDVFLGVASNTNWATNTADSTFIHAGYRISTGAQNAFIEFNVYLGVGTWTLDVMYGKGSNIGIYTFALDGGSLGTVDGYNASGLKNQVASLTPFAVTTAGLKALRVTMATKNASSSSYFGQLQAIKIYR